MINKDRLVKLTQGLIRIDSQNPPGNEEAIARFVAKRLQGLGLRVKFYEFARKRTNIVASLKPRRPRYSLLISPHLDTVPAGKRWKFNPFKGVISNGKIYGRGATDCKGNLACGMEVLQSLVEDKTALNYEIIFAATADEESGSQSGIIPLLDKRILKPDYAVILDADEFKITIAQKGLIHATVSLFGKQAHGAYPSRGVNAIEIAARVIERLKNHKFRFKAHPLLRPPTINIGTIRGGEKVNMVADYCRMEIDLRFLPGMRKESVLNDVRKIIEKESKKFKINIQGTQEPYEISKQHPLVEGLKKASREVIGKASLSASEGATVITFFKKHNIPAIAFGCGRDRCAHTTDEYIKINDLYKGALILEKFLKLFNKE